MKKVSALSGVLLTAIITVFLLIGCKTTEETGQQQPDDEMRIEWDYEPQQLTQTCQDCRIMWGEGYADIREAGEGEAIERAVSDAKRDCIERVVGYYLTKDVMAESGVMVMNEVYRRSGGVVKNYEILEQEVRYDGEIMYVRIEAEVKVQDVKEAIEMTTEEIISEMQYPVITVVNYESLAGTVDTSGQGLAGTMLLQHFKDTGYNVRDISSAPDKERKAVVQALQNEDELELKRAARDLGRAMGSRMVVVVKTIVEDRGPVNAYGHQSDVMNTYVATINATVILADNGEIMATMSQEGRFPNNDVTAGSRQAIARVIDDNHGYDVLNEKVLASWKEIKRAGMWIDMYVTGVDLLEGRRLAKKMVDTFHECTECILTSGQQEETLHYRVRWRFGQNGLDLAIALKNIGPRFAYKVQLKDYTVGEVYAEMEARPGWDDSEY